jgi:hypothetical protein
MTTTKDQPAEKPSNQPKPPLPSPFQVAKQFENIGSPRLILFAILCLATTAGIASSSIFLLELHIQSMAIRYSLSFVAGYIIFLLLIRTWAGIESLRFNRKQAKKLPNTEPQKIDALPFDGLDLLSGADSLPILGIILAALAGLGLFFSFINLAPVLLGELILDLTIAGTAYKSLTKPKHKHWVHTIFRHTYIQAFIIFGICFFTGAALDKLTPQNHTLKSAIHELRSQPSNP